MCYEIPKTPDEPYRVADTRTVGRLLRDIEDEEPWNVMQQRLQKIDVGHRMQLMEVVSHCRNPQTRIVDLLASFLDDESQRVIPEYDPFDDEELNLYDGPCTVFFGKELTVGNFAVELLAYELEVKRSDIPTARTPEDWATLRQRVDVALSKRNMN